MTTTNVTSAAKELILLFPRLARKAFLFPDALDDVRYMVFNGGSVIADATSTPITNTSTRFAQATATSWTQGVEESAYSMFGKLVEGVGKVKNLGGVFSYLTSRWALTTFAAAIILNRTQFYASSREHLHLRWYTRLLIYTLPICAFLLQMRTILEAIRCQTSPDFAQLRYGDSNKQLPMDFGGEGGFLHNLSSVLLWQDDASCCAARGMTGDTMRGSMSLLFGFFVTLCASQLFETLACALQGRQPVPETGMTLFEHSLAFAECEAMISSALGLGYFSLPKVDSAEVARQSGIFLTRHDVLQRLNVPPEVLLVCLISCFSHLSSALLAIGGIRDKVRLINTGVWACAYMAAFIWSFMRLFATSSAITVSELGVLRFPTVCVVGFIPHVLILAGILLCSTIYAFALLLTATSVPESIAPGMSLPERLRWAYTNLQANVQFQGSIRLKMSDDFYTTILKVGFQVLTAASEAVYLNEGLRIRIAENTWLERKRLNEVLAEAQHARPQVPSELLGEEIARGVQFVEHHKSDSVQSPYARERRSKPKTAEDHRLMIEVDSGLGVAQRRSRMQLTFDFVASVFWLIVGIHARLASHTLRKLGLQSPAWLLRATGKPHKAAQSQTNSRRLSRSLETGFWPPGEGEDDEAYEPSLGDLDDDATSFISTDSSMAYDSDRGDRTPTQASFNGFADFGSREGTPDSDVGFNYENLSELLNPSTLEAREQARLLSFSLRARRPMTRQHFRKSIAHERSRLLFSGSAQSLPDDQEHELEGFILQQRRNARQKTGTSWATGAEGMGEGGPQCVVCQSTPRTILVWPCGCLSMCDDCRIGLAARNFTQCVCCRTDIAAYSRLYVP